MFIITVLCILMLVICAGLVTYFNRLDCIEAETFGNGQG